MGEAFEGGAGGSQSSATALRSKVEITEIQFVFYTTDRIQIAADSGS